MSAQQIYDPVMDHPPRFLAHGLPHARPITVDDLDAFPPEPFWKYELIDGCLIVTPNAPSFRHQSCIGSLYILLRRACPPELTAVLAPFEYLPPPLAGHPEDVVSTQPDVLVAARPIPDKRLTDPPILVVEVLSPYSRRNDLTNKLSLYAELGVPHYWIVDPDAPSVRVLGLVDGEYQEQFTAKAGERLTVTEPVALSFDPAELLDE